MDLQVHHGVVGVVAASATAPRLRAQTDHVVNSHVSRVLQHPVSVIAEKCLTLQCNICFKVGSHRAKAEAKIFLDVCDLFFDLFCL